MDDVGTTAPIFPRCQSSMPEDKFSQKAVRRALSSLDIHKFSGPNGIPPLLLRSCAPELTPVLTFQQSYSVDVIPDSWKSALIHPILKKNDGELQAYCYHLPAVESNGEYYK